MRLILVGFGTVGQGFAEILRDKAAMLEQKHGLNARVVGVATRSRGVLYHPEGLDLDVLLDAIERSSLNDYPEMEGLEKTFDALSLVKDGVADVLVEASPTNLTTAEPALSYFKAALSSGKHVVTANKGPVALAYPHLKQLAADKGLHLRFEASVMAGTPAIATGIELLAGCTIEEAYGIFNGTTNYILTQMEGGLSYEDALARAQKLGYAETDPSGDVEGWDAAAKVLILGATIFGEQWQMDDLDVTGITGISQTDIELAKQSGERYKLIASATAEGGSVAPQRIRVTHPLAQVGGATNAITYKTDLMGDITLIGAGAGRKETGFALLSDLLAIKRLTT